MKSIPHAKRIMQHLREYGEIDPMTALREYGIYRLGARIYDLRKEYEITTRFEQITNRFGDDIRHAVYGLVGWKPVVEGKKEKGKKKKKYDRQLSLFVRNAQ